MKSSAIVLMIGGVLKELLTIFIGAEIFGDNVNRKNLSGCAVVFSGVILYKYLFHAGKNNDELLNTNEMNLKHGQDYAEITMTDTDDCARKSSSSISSTRQRRYINNGSNSSRGSSSEDELSPRIVYSMVA